MQIKITDNETIETLIITFLQENTNDDVNVELSYIGKNKYELILHTIAFFEKLNSINK